MVRMADIIGRGLGLQSSGKLSTRTKAYTGKRQRGIGGYLRLFFVCIMITPILICGCGYNDGGLEAGSISQEANDLFNRGEYAASLSKYEQIFEKNPAVADRVLFEMGIIYAHPGNEHKNYLKSLECFQKLVRS